MRQFILKMPLLLFFIPIILLSQTPQIDHNDQKFIFNYFEAEKYKITEEHDLSLFHYEKCIEINPIESAPYNEIAKIYFYQESWSDAEYYISKAIDLSPSVDWYYYLLIDIYAMQEKYSEQLSIYSILIKMYPTKFQYHLQKIKLLKETKQYRSAIKYFNKTQRMFGDREETLLELQEIFLLQEKNDLAINIGIQLIENSPNNIPYYGMLASIYMRFNDYDSAIKTYYQLLQINPNDPAAHVALYQIYSNRKDLKNQSKHLLSISKNEQIPLVTKKEIFYGVLLNNEIKYYPLLKEIIYNCHNAHPEEQLFKVLLGDVLLFEGDYVGSLGFYESAISSGLIKDQYIYHKIIEICLQKLNYQKSITYSDLAISYFPVIPEFFYYKAIALMQLKDYESCLSSLLKGKDFVIENNKLHSDFLSMIGDCYHYLNRHNKSDEAYKEALIYNADNIFVLNNFSYYLSLRESSLELALEMAERCDSLTKDVPNSSFLDTYAWVLFQLEEYELAKEKIEQALLLNPNSVVALKHYSEILLKLGLVSQSKIYLEKAYQIDPTNPILLMKDDINSKDK